MRLALAYNAKPTARSAIEAVHPETVLDEEEEPPPLTAGVGSNDDAYAEWDDAPTILALAGALANQFDVSLVEADARFPSRVQRLKPDIVFNVAEGMVGPAREAHVPAILEMLRIPYSGSDSLTLAVCLHKAWANVILAANGVPTPRHRVIEGITDLDSPWEILFPIILKPLHEGSSKGIRDDQVVGSLFDLRVRAARLLRDYHQPVLAEQFLQGREFTVAILGNPPDVRVLPPVELRFDAFPPGTTPIYSWEAKWLWDRPDSPLDVFQCPAGLSFAQQAEIEQVCQATARILRIRDWARIDVRMDAAGVVHVMEVNPLPGMLPDPDAHSCYPKAARAAGMTYDDVVLAVVDAACRRWGLRS
ncbi:D-alanine--D-alanine ligase [Candidatus Fermentibacteria bacterium]|nr:D-alanine--D-alanine ligase [Candidatus Fermentibacteria bacterium]